MIMSLDKAETFAVIGEMCSMLGYDVTSEHHTKLSSDEIQNFVESVCIDYDIEITE